MGNFLKGNYKLDIKEENKKKSSESEEKANEFRERALASIGGSMVFVEREMYVWNGDNEDSLDD
jgi:hypothetical protein